MTVKWETIAQEGFQFFGKMSASLSHEIKNALAILNENAGLIEDWMVLAEQGRPLDPVRLKTMAGKMTLQIRRADTLVKRLNAFAHSADTRLQMVDLATALEPIVAIVQRPAAMAEATVSLILPGHPVQTRTYLFLLENLLWLTINYLLAKGNREIKLIPQVDDDGPRIRVVGQADFFRNWDRTYPPPPERELIGVLKAGLRVDLSAGEIAYLLPKNVSNEPIEGR